MANFPDLVNVEFFSDVGRDLAQATDADAALAVLAGIDIGEVGRRVLAAATEAEARDILMAVSDFDFRLVPKNAVDNFDGTANG